MMQSGHGTFVVSLLSLMFVRSRVMSDSTPACEASSSPADDYPTELRIARSLIQELHALGAPTVMLSKWLANRASEFRAKPSEADLRWPVEQPTVVAEHITLGNDRPVLSCKLQVGRAYSLTPGQRDVVRDWFNMTPAPLIEVLEVALYPGTQYIQRVTLKSCEHVDPRRRRVMTKFAIDKWGEFCSQAKQRDTERAEAREGDPVDDDESDKPAKKSTKKQPLLSELMNEYGV
jgi:hypothetical protein